MQKNVFSVLLQWIRAVAGMTSGNTAFAHTPLPIVKFGDERVCRKLLVFSQPSTLTALFLR